MRGKVGLSMVGGFICLLDSKVLFQISLIANKTIITIKFKTGLGGKGRLHRLTFVQWIYFCRG